MDRPLLPICPPGHFMVGDRAVPEPMREAPERGTRYWYVEVSSKCLVWPKMWIGDEHDLLMLECGLGHLTEAPARIHAEAVIALSAKRSG